MPNRSNSVMSRSHCLALSFSFNVKELSICVVDERLVRLRSCVSRAARVRTRPVDVQSAQLPQLRIATLVWANIRPSGRIGNPAALLVDGRYSQAHLDDS